MAISQAMVTSFKVGVLGGTLISAAAQHKYLRLLCLLIQLRWVRLLLHTPPLMKLWARATLRAGTL
jgi:hypothetical protein